MTSALVSLGYIAERMPASPPGAARAAVIAHADCPICDSQIGATCEGLTGGALHFERIEVFQRFVLPDLWPSRKPAAPAAAPRSEAPPRAKPWHPTRRGTVCTAKLWPVEGLGGNTVGWSCNVCRTAFGLTSIYAPQGSPSANGTRSS